MKIFKLSIILVILCLWTLSSGADEPRQVKVPTFKPVSPQATTSGNSSDIQSLMGSCDEMKSSVINTYIPSNASITSSQETVMFMTKTALDMIANNCLMEPGTTFEQIALAKQEYLNAYLAAEQACNKVQSAGRRCFPQKHF